MLNKAPLRSTHRDTILLFELYDRNDTTRTFVPCYGSFFNPTTISRPFERDVLPPIRHALSARAAFRRLQERYSMYVSAEYDIIMAAMLFKLRCSERQDHLNKNYLQTYFSPHRSIQKKKQLTIKRQSARPASINRYTFPWQLMRIVALTTSSSDLRFEARTLCLTTQAYELLRPGTPDCSSFDKIDDYIVHSKYSFMTHRLPVADNHALFESPSFSTTTTTKKHAPRALK